MGNVKYCGQAVLWRSSFTCFSSGFETKRSQTFCNYSLMVPLVEFLGQNPFHPNFKVYTDDMCTFHNQVSDFRYSVRTTGLILLFYMLVILGIMFREFDFRNIMSWLRDNHNLYLKYVYGKCEILRSSNLIKVLFYMFQFGIVRKWLQKFYIFFPDGTPCWIFRAKTLSFEFWSLHWWYEYISQSNIWFWIFS